MGKEESSVQKKIIQWLESEFNAFVIKTMVSNRSGVPDILACVNGRFVAIEVKKAEGIEPSKLQEVKIRRITASGGIAFVAGSVAQAKRLYTQAIE